jgi:hypothetical protein
MSAPGESPPEKAAPLAGDRELLETILADGTIQQAPQEPGISDYVGHLASEAASAIGGWLSRTFGGTFDFNGLVGALGWVLPLARGFLICLALALLLWIARALWRRWRGPEATPAGVEVVPIAGSGQAGGRDWDAELEGRLAAGDGRGSLEALWFWLAQRLGAEVEAARFTTRELLLAAGRKDLRRSGRELDRLLYAPERPTLDAIRAVRTELRKALGEGER